MTELEKVRKELMKLTRAVNTTRGEEKAKLIEKKEKVMKEYYKLKNEEEQER